MLDLISNEDLKKVNKDTITDTYDDILWNWELRLRSKGVKIVKLKNKNGFCISGVAFSLLAYQHDKYAYSKEQILFVLNEVFRLMKMLPSLQTSFRLSFDLLQ